MSGGNTAGNYKYAPQSDYNQEDITAAKNSLQLLKAKQQANRAEEMIGSEQRNAYPQYGGSSNSGSTGSYSNIKGSNSDWRGNSCSLM